METRRQGVPLITAIATLIGTVVVLQLWILAALIEALMGGDTRTSLATAIAEVALAALNAGLLAHVVAFDRRLRRLGRSPRG